MKSDCDRLMSSRLLDAIVVFGPDGLGPVNAAFNYFVGGRHIVGLVIKKLGRPAVLIHGTMERDAAAETGLELINITRWPRKEIEQQFPDPFDARVEMNRRIFTDLGLTGRVGVYGIVDASSTLALVRELERKVPGLTLVAEGHRDLIQTARETKDADEIAAMAEVGQATCALVGEVRDWLRRHAVRDETLVRSDGRPLTIGDVKAFVRDRLTARELEGADFAFSIGRDAGVPHNHGNPADLVRLGRSIVFDIFPRRPGGYYHDVTRTWCLGYAPPEVEAAFRDVYDCFHAVVAMVGAPPIRTHRLQNATCDFFEKRGHPTIRQDPKLDHGYIHSLGHGLGLDVHEHPNSPTFTDTGAEIAPGVVYTVEPGLYYPDKGFGVRIEDTYVCDHDGKFRSLTPFPQDLVVPMG